MAEIRTLKLNLLADIGDFSKGLETAQMKFQNFGSKLDNISQKAVIALGVVSVAFKSTVDAAADLNESVNKSAVVFGDATDQIMQFSKTSASAIGLSQKATLEAAADFAIFGKAAGLSGKQLGNFSTELLTLAADLASFNNASIEETINAIGAGLRGESEPLRRFGVLLSADAVNAEALAMGLAKSNKEITDQDKVLARQSLILQQTTIQQGDFARTAEGAANAQRILAAQVEDSKTKIGQGLLPVYQQMLKLLVPLTEWTSKNASALGSMILVVGGLAAGIIALNYTVKAINGTFEAFNNIMKLATAAQALFNVVMGLNPAALVVIAIVALGAAFVAAYKNIEPFRDLIDSIWSSMKRLLDTIKNSAIAGAVTKAFNAVTGRAMGGSVSAGNAYTVGEFGKEVFVPSTNGTIVPNNQIGGSNVTVNLNGIIDAESARRSIEKLLQDSARRTGAINLVGATL
jgi:hypothetical protein